MAIAEDEVTVVLQEGDAVRIVIDTADVEGLFDAYRLSAEVTPAPGVFGVPQDAYAAGGNDIVLFTGVSWSEPHGGMAGDGLSEHSTIHFSGHPMQLSETAEVVCITTDSAVVATPDGTGVLIRVGLRPGSLEVEQNPEKVRAFLVERGYGQQS